jgi:hypothetical protein
MQALVGGEAARETSFLIFILFFPIINDKEAARKTLFFILSLFCLA